MTDRADPESDSPETAEVRRLLADARHTEPVPDDVRARLDEVLTGLVAERSGSTEPHEPAAPVIPIEPARRRRAAALLVAAAAIVVGGVVAAQNLHLSSTSSNGAASAAEDAPRAQALNGDQHANSGKGHSPEPSMPSSGRAMPQGQSPFVVRPRHFAADAREGRTLLGRVSAPQAFDSLNAACAQLAKKSRVVPAQYRHAPAALVYRRPAGNSQVVDLFVCGSREPVRTTTLPAP